MEEHFFEGELRLFLEEVCCDLVRMRHVSEDGIAAHDMSIAREVKLGSRAGFADIIVTLPGGPAYFIEIKFGLSLEDTVRRIRRKFATNPRPACNRLIVVTRDLPAELLTVRLRACVCPSLDVEVWDEAHLIAEVERHYGHRIDSFHTADFGALHRAVLETNSGIAFPDHEDDGQIAALLWHFNPWTLKRMRDEGGFTPAAIRRAGNHSDIVIVMADLCSFSSYVRDTPSDDIVRSALTAFYSHARQAVHEHGGMLDKFVGDEVIGLFGFPDKRPGYLTDALNCAKALLDIGESTALHWQQRLDRVQKSAGVHIGIAIGDLHLMPMRPFTPTHLGFIGDSVNVAARLMEGVAGPGEIVVSNRFYNMLDEDLQDEFEEAEPVEAKNVGLIKSWRRRPD